MNATLRQLRVFQSVAQTRNFSRTGETVGLTQPAVSRAIAELERELGLRLLDRTTREVELTEAGRSLATRLDRALDELDATLADVAALADADGGKVRVASSPTLSAYLMPDCIAACTREAPRVRFLLLDRIQQDVLESVRGGEVDFGVTVEPADAEAFDSETIMHDPFVLVCRRDHVLAARAQVAWKKLKGQPLVLLDYASGSRRLIDRQLSHHAIDALVVQQTGHTHTAFSMVEAGLGVTITPGLSTASLPASLVALSLTPVARRAITLIRRRHRSLSPVAELVWSQVRTTAKALTQS